MTEDDLTLAIADWLDAERASHAAAFAQVGVARHVQSDMPTVIERSEGRITYGRRPRLVNPLTVRGLATLPKARLKPPTPAAALHDAFGDRCYFWSPLVRPNFDSEPLAWIDEAFLDHFAFSFAASLDDLGSREQRSTRRGKGTNRIRVERRGAVEDVDADRRRSRGLSARQRISHPSAPH